MAQQMETPSKKKLTKAKKKNTNISMLTGRPSRGNSSSAKLRNGAASAYWGYKAFQALRMCSGDVTVLAEIASELLAEGLIEGVASNPELVVQALEALMGTYGGIQGFRMNIKNFGQFSAALSKQLNSQQRNSEISDGQSRTNGEAMENAEHLYESFTQCDRDGSGCVSIEEYVTFCSSQGMSRSMAEITFFRADMDGNGEISFEEWTAMMMGRVGRDQNGFNCGGHHGLAGYTAVYNGLNCSFCFAPIHAGCLAMGCRRCDCDACASCAGLPLYPPPRPAKPLPQLPGEGKSGGENAKEGTKGTIKKKKKKKAENSEPSPPQYHEAMAALSHDGHSAPSSSNAASASAASAAIAPPSYEEMTTVSMSPGEGSREQLRSPADGEEPPFCFDSVVRVIGVDDPKILGKLMTVIGFEPSDGGAGGEGGIVLLQKKGKVFRVPASNVYRVLD